jgi:type II secretory pathway predicted ATPase ExeA
MANGGSWGFGEFLRQIMGGLGIDYKAYQPSTMIRLIQAQIQALSEDGKQVIIAIDEADKLRNDVFYQLHLLVSAPDKGESLASIILCGQEMLADKLANPAATPMRSRMYPGYYIAPVNRQTYRKYVRHHMELCGLREDIVDDLALEHIWKATSGNLRSIGMTFRFALQYAANQGIARLDAACAKAAFSEWWEISPVQSELPES